LHAARKQGGIRIGAVLNSWRQRWQRAVRSLKPEYLFCDVDDLPRWGKLRVGGSHVAVFEITDPAHAMQLARRGVEFIETFAIGEMLEQLEIHRSSRL
jgi:glycerophosphoryl diester phosphodiesterase